MDKLKYVIVQAGGKGSRLEGLTRNKPKALVSIHNKPMLFNLFDKFNDANFIICADYKYDVMERYLKTFAKNNYKIVDARGSMGTCGGLAECLNIVPENTPFMLIWCDLFLGNQFNIDNVDINNKNYVGLSQDFVCRWKYENGIFTEEKSQDYGVAGLFVFKDKSCLQNVPDNGEFVRWLSEQDIKFDTIGLRGCVEYGVLDVVNSIKHSKCRPFNKLTIVNDKILKEGIDEQGKQLAKREQNWYKFIANKEFKNLPKIYNLDPILMEKIDGEPIYTFENLSINDKKIILKEIVDCLKNLHKLGEIPTHLESFENNYIDKTLERLEKVKDLVPFARDEFITINSKACKNIFYVLDEVKEEIKKYIPKSFKFIHGDCTFSNILLDNKNKKPVLIDPRGYFGKTELFGDAGYDWAKLYYSILTNYDQFNLKRFTLHINDADISINIQSNKWEELKDYYLDLIKDEVTEEQLNLMLALIWLSLTTYAWDDYDSICGAFYYGTLLLNECEFIKKDK